MTQIIKSRKEQANFTIEQKLDYAKLMVNENYSNKKIIAISGAGPSAVTRWKKQYLAVRFHHVVPYLQKSHSETYQVL